MSRQNKKKGAGQVMVRRGKVNSVAIFEVRDSELDQLEKGSPLELQLNFAIFFISFSLSCGTTVLTASFTNPRIENAFLFATIVGFAFGLYLSVSWWKGRGSIRALCSTIRARLTPDGIESEETCSDESIPDKLEENGA